MLLNAMANELQEQVPARAILSGQVKTNKWESVMIFSFTAGQLLSFTVDSIHLGFGGWHQIESTSLTYQ